MWMKFIYFLKITTVQVASGIRWNSADLCVWYQLLCLIGEAFEEQTDDVCGAVVNIRNKGDKLAIWTQDATRNDATVRIGSVVKA